MRSVSDIASASASLTGADHVCLSSWVRPVPGLTWSGASGCAAAPTAPVPVWSDGSMVSDQSIPQLEAARLIGGLLPSLMARAMANVSLPRMDASLPALPDGLVALSGTGKDGVSVALTV